MNKEITTIVNTLAKRQPGIMGADKYRQSAVLIPLVEVDGETHILFEVRSMLMRSQPGDICFPGGRIDPDDQTATYCAIRETTEELGISENSISNVTPIDYVVADMGRIIYPFVGTITSIDEISPNPAEVEEVFTVPLSYLKQYTPKSFKVNVHLTPEENFPFDLIVGGEKYNWKTRPIEELFYKYEDKVIWGLTAKILRHFVSLID